MMTRDVFDARLSALGSDTSPQGAAHRAALLRVRSQVEAGLAGRAPPRAPKPPTIADKLREQMLATGRKRAWAGDPDLLLEAYEAAGGRVVHPLDRIKATLDAARRSKLFHHAGYIRACDRTGMREIRHPYFVLAEVASSPSP
ncbi:MULTISPECIES: hypothetical protein [Xanthomonas]|uniref:Uncharacterized protein n=3 Tax=Xanthomonas TaxID=338 RepID=A0A7Z7IYB2_XANCH|nr:MULTISPECIES: hypothetical protein [Xanthomonas]WOP59120.1 hypothetical protein R5577_22985 [Xanthomonas euvesicatoria]SOO23812.1 hypothetical protein XFF6991_30132 [Xanthomonas phaseoli pv. phaseoli]